MLAHPGPATPRSRPNTLFVLMVLARSVQHTLCAHWVFDKAPYTLEASGPPRRKTDLGLALERLVAEARVAVPWCVWL